MVKCPGKIHTRHRLWSEPSAGRDSRRRQELGEQGCTAELWDNKSRAAAGWAQAKSHIQGRGKGRKSLGAREPCSLEKSAGPRLHGNVEEWE